MEQHIDLGLEVVKLAIDLPSTQGQGVILEMNLSLQPQVVYPLGPPALDLVQLKDLK
jgi:hypothetical protein